MIKDDDKTQCELNIITQNELLMKIKNYNELKWQNHSNHK